MTICLKNSKKNNNKHFDKDRDQKQKSNSIKNNKRCKRDRFQMTQYDFPLLWNKPDLLNCFQKSDHNHSQQSYFLNCKQSVVFTVSLQGVDSLWGDCTFIPADWGS